MELKIIKKEIGRCNIYNLDNDCLYNISTQLCDVLDFIKNIELLGADVLEFSVSHGYDNDVEDIDIIGIRQYRETEEQAKERIEKENRMIASDKIVKFNKERKEYLRLKAKFDPDPNLDKAKENLNNLTKEQKRVVNFYKSIGE